MLLDINTQQDQQVKDKVLEKYKKKLPEHSTAEH